MNRADMLKRIQAISNLPTLPVIVMEINKLLQDYESPVERLVELLEKDQSLVLKILRLVNSSFFGFKSKVSSLRHSVTLLGYGTIQSAIVSIGVIDALVLKKKLNGYDISQFWEHSIQVAVMSKYLAVNTRIAPAEDAFAAGLLHDIGKVVLANYFPDIFVRIIETMHTGSLTFSEAEKTMDMDVHSHIGGILAQRWMLPDTLVRTIRHHHNDTDRPTEPQLTALVSMSDAIVHKMAGEGGYHLGMNSLSGDDKKTLTAFLSGGSQWYKEVKAEMLKASSFFKQGEDHGN